MEANVALRSRERHEADRARGSERWNRGTLIVLFPLPGPNDDVINLPEVFKCHRRVGDGADPCRLRMVLLPDVGSRQNPVGNDDPAARKSPSHEHFSINN